MLLKRSLSVLSLLLVSLFVLASPTRAQSPPTSAETALYRISIGTNVAAAAADIATTHRATELGIGTEGNPLLVKRDGSASYVRKSAILATSVLVTHKLVWERGRRRLAILTNFAVAGLQILAAAHNRRVVREFGPPSGLPQARSGPTLALRF